MEDKDYILKRLNIDSRKDFAKARKEFEKAWKIACKYCEKERGLPTYNCEYCPLVNTMMNFQEYSEDF